MSKFENIFQQGQDKIKRTARVGALAVGLGAGMVLANQEALAQENDQDKIIKTKASEKSEAEKQWETAHQGLESPQRYDLSKKHDRSGLKKERQTNPEELLKYNINQVKISLERTKNRIFLTLTPTGAEIREPGTSDLEEQKKLIKEYEEYLINPSLDVKNVGELEFDQEDFELNKKITEFHDKKIQEIADHINSPEYLKKLMAEYNIDETAAKEHQKTRLNNLYNGTYSLTDNDPSFYEDGNNFETQLTKRPAEAPFSDEHELLGHKVVAGDHISRNANKLLRLSYQKFNPESPYFKSLLNADNQKDLDYLINNLDYYFGSKGERYARKQEVEAEMTALGIKTYGEKFTKEHYDKLINFYKEGKLSKDACRFIETTKPEYFEKIFNEIADAGDNGKTFYSPNFNYNQPENPSNKA